MAIRYRYYFMEALVATVVLFVIGFLIGFSIEQSRNNELVKYYSGTEDAVSSLEDQLDITNLGKYTCSELINRNFYIADQIYEQALVFDRYENSAIFTKSQLIREHRKFDVLRTLFWINSIKIKERCGQNIYDTVVYLYDYQSEEVEEIAKQRIMARITGEIKDISQNEIILIPIAKNLNISSLNALIEKYDFANESTLLIVNERKIFLSNQTEEIRDYFKINL